VDRGDTPNRFVTAVSATTGSTPTASRQRGTRPAETAAVDVDDVFLSTLGRGGRNAIASGDVSA